MPLADPVALRRLSLRIMLGALAASAGLGILTALIPHGVEVYRMIGTSVAAAIASGLLLGACRLPDSPRNRRTGLLMMAFILVEFLVVMVAIWNPLRIISVSSPFDDDQLWLATVMFPVAAIPAAIYFHIRQLRGGHFAGIAGLVFSAASLVFFLIAILSEINFLSSGSEKYWMSGWACWFMAIAMGSTLAGAGTDRRHWRWLGFAAAMISFAMALYGTWAEPQNSDNPFILVTTLTILIGYTNLLWLCKLKPNHHWLRWTTAAFAWIACVIIDFAIAGSGSDEDVFARSGLATGICAGCGTVAVALLAAFNRKSSITAEAMELKSLALTCPICAAQQTFLLSHNAAETSCTACGLKFKIQLNVPHCPNCNYSLLMLKSDRCPECGELVGTPSLPSLSDAGPGAIPALDNAPLPK